MKSSELLFNAITGGHVPVAMGNLSIEMIEKIEEGIYLPDSELLTNLSGILEVSEEKLFGDVDFENQDLLNLISISGRKHPKFNGVWDDYAKKYNELAEKYANSEVWRDIEELLECQVMLDRCANLIAYRKGKDHGVSVMLKSNMLLGVSIPSDFRHTYLVDRIATDLVSINDFKTIKEIQSLVSGVVKKYR